jgi:hypothetical protein
MYTQCLLQYEHGRKGVAWIKADKARKGADVEVGDSKADMRPVKVLEVYGSREYSEIRQIR